MKKYHFPGECVLLGNSFKLFWKFFMINIWVVWNYFQNYLQTSYYKVFHIFIKVTSATRLFLALDVYMMIFFNVSFLRYLDFCVFVKSTDFKICDVIIGIATQCKLHLCLFLLYCKYYQNEIWPNTSVLYAKHF